VSGYLRWVAFNRVIMRTVASLQVVTVLLETGCPGQCETRLRESDLMPMTPLAARLGATLDRDTGQFAARAAPTTIAASSWSGQDREHGIQALWAKRCP
jgi:hypothetical protein